MNDIIELDPNYSTTRRPIKSDPQEIADLVKTSNKSEYKFETVLLLPEGEGRQGGGGLRTNDYFKVGGIIPSLSTPRASRDETISST